MAAKRGWVWALIPLLFLVIYFPVFYADYAYLDEIHQLWHHDDDTNFRMFHTQGRWLTGLIFQNFFSSINSIAQLKLLRIFSFFGWLITALAWTGLLKRWVRQMNFAVQLWWAGSVYVACCIPVAIYIGWASCLEVFLAVGAALLSGALLFEALFTKRQGARLWLMIAGSFFLGVVSLFIYQNAYGVFLIPFLLYYWHKGRAAPGRLLVTGVAVHLITYGLYYLLFRQSLIWYGMEASNRTEVHLDFLSKLSFFFAGPVPQGFSLNLLFSARSIFSQLFYPAVILFWLFCIFKRNRQSLVQNLLFVVVILGILAIIYLPLMIAKEDFPSYRTLFAFNLAVFLMVVDGLLFLFKNSRKKGLLLLVVIAWLAITGFYSYRQQFVGPLQKEYSILHNFMKKNYRPGLQSVHFIRADKFMFTPRFHTMVYRDEFGAPSTYRDWVPEPITRQLVYEISGDRQKAKTISVTQYENREAFDAARPVLDSNALLVDMNRIFQEPN